MPRNAAKIFANARLAKNTRNSRFIVEGPLFAASQNTVEFKIKATDREM